MISVAVVLCLLSVCSGKGSEEAPLGGDFCERSPGDSRCRLAPEEDEASMLLVKQKLRPAKKLHAADVCTYGEHVVCPDDRTWCAGNQCCQPFAGHGSSTCPSANVAHVPGCQEPKIIDCLQPEVTTVKTPDEFLKSLGDVIAGGSCDAKYEVDDSLYGIASLFNVPSQSDGHLYPPEQAVAWFSEPGLLQQLLTDKDKGCCGVDITTKPQCFCRISCAVGLNGYEGDIPPNFWEYVVSVAQPTNHTNHEPLKQLNLISPTWDNLLHMKSGYEDSIYTTSFKYVFAGMAGIPSCNPSADVISELKTIPGEEQWDKLWDQNSSKLSALGLTADGGWDMDVDQQRQQFLALGNELCNDAAYVRAYLLRWFDCNPLFEGTGITSGGEYEFIAFPNPTFDSLKGSPMLAQSFNFEFPKSSKTVCPTDCP